MRIIFPSVWSSASIMYLQALLIFVSATDVILKHIRTHSIRFPTSLCRYLFAQLMRDQEHSCSKRVYSKCIHKTTKKLHYTQSLFCFLASTHYVLYEKCSPYILLPLPNHVLDHKRSHYTRFTNQRIQGT